MNHDDEAGQPCTRHAASTEKLLDYAIVGSRASSFHHDTASKLQSMMMALDEISELIGEAPSELRTATETAQQSLRELHGLLTANRALAKSPHRSQATVADMLERAASRGAVKLEGELPAVEVVAAVPAITHALSILLDLVAGATQSGRLVRIRADGTNVTILGNTEPTNPNANELIAIAAHVIARDGGHLRCAPKGFVVQISARSAAASP